MTQSIVVFIQEAAAMAGLSESSISRLCTEGKFVAPISVKGGKRRWLRADIEAYLASQSTVTQPTAGRKLQRYVKAFEERQQATDKALDQYRAKKEA
jgi:predicted DNA-binding transcriptional regulator AlpA